MIVEQPAVGVVVVRQILSLEEQLKLIEIIERNGELRDNNGDWNFKNHSGIAMRGRNFKRINNYLEDDAKFLMVCTEKFKNIIENLDETLKFLPVTHMLTLWYPSSVGVGFHKDGFNGNDGDVGAPVYSLTLGNTCDFTFKLVGEKKTQSVELCSGDIIVFGGPQRLMGHSCKKIFMNSFDKKEGFNARINLTFRTCSNFNDEDDENYKTENYSKKLQEERNKKNNIM